MTRATALLLTLALLLAPVSGVRRAHAEYFMQFGYLSVTDGGNRGGSVRDGDTIDRYASRFQFEFYDLLDQATIAPNLTVTGPDGNPQTWQLDAPAGANWFILTPPSVLEPEATYTLHVRGGTDGILNGDGAPMAADLHFALTTEADTPFRLESISQNSADGPPILNDGSFLPRNATMVNVRFSHPVNSESARQLIDVTRVIAGEAQDPGWQMRIEGRSVYFTWPQRLPRVDAEYFISVPQAVQDTAGHPLAEAPLTTGVRTLNRPYRFTTQWQTTWKQYGVQQVEEFGFFAAPGELQLRLFWDGTPTVVRAMIVEEATNQLMAARHLLLRGESGLTLNLPREGRYRLQIASNRFWTVTVTGMDLELNPLLPALTLPPPAPFATVNEPVSYGPVVGGPEAETVAGIYRNNTTLFEGRPGADGVIGPVTVDPGEMPDGIFYLTTVGAATGTENLALQSVPLLVDRIASFPDVPVWHWARPYIEALHDDKIINGHPDGQFAPGDPVTRAEFAKMLALTLGLAPDPATPNPFADVPAGHWAEDYIRALWETGLVTGEVVDGVRYFYPDRTISRAEAATILGRTLGFGPQEPEGRAFTDWDQVPGWARSSVLALSIMGWINGEPDGGFHPDGQLQRDQTAKLLAQFYLP